MLKRRRTQAASMVHVAPAPAFQVSLPAAFQVPALAAVSPVAAVQLKSRFLIPLRFRYLQQLRSRSLQQLRSKYSTRSGSLRKNAPPPGSHVFQPIQTIFKLVQDIIRMNLLTKFHED
ncbi:hypothetical protein DPMN_081068 [Dreissena polymorpha]|uniref:Uncharacterized protein n=1 Tax=Dreissena polymorpha TaxID=45954 RepID=A0A9D3Y7Z1_DREPO|nr:hypothetical protein DPMN_081068 [Dreissena polymorpha]